MKKAGLGRLFSLTLRRLLGGSGGSSFGGLGSFGRSSSRSGGSFGRLGGFSGLRGFSSGRGRGRSGSRRFLLATSGHSEGDECSEEERLLHFYSLRSIERVQQRCTVEWSGRRLTRKNDSTRHFRGASLCCVATTDSLIHEVFVEAFVGFSRNSTILVNTVSWEFYQGASGQPE